MKILHPNQDEFTSLIKENKLSVVDFFATWCGPCKMFGPILESVAGEYTEGVNFAKVGIDENLELTIDHNIQAVPTIVFYKNGIELKRVTGLMSADELRNTIEENK